MSAFTSECDAEARGEARLQEEQRAGGWRVLGRPVPQSVYHGHFMQFGRSVGRRIPSSYKDTCQTKPRPLTASQEPHLLGKPYFQ